MTKVAAKTKTPKSITRFAKPAAPRGPVVPPSFRDLDWKYLGSGLWAAVGALTVVRAEDALKFNKKNRKSKKSTALAYAGAIGRSEWALTGEPISFDTAGILSDGQHRAEGVVTSGKPIEQTLFVAGVPRSAFAATGIGLPRSNADVLYLDGNDHPIMLAAVVTTQNRFDKGTVHHTSNHGRAEYPSPKQSLRILRAHPGLKSSVAYVKGREGFRDLSKQPSLAWLHYHLGRIDAAARDQFFHGLETGSELPAGSPILHLRRFLTNQKSAKAKLPAVHTLARTIKAWNSWRAGFTLSVLSWRDDEDFPVAV